MKLFLDRNKTLLPRLDSFYLATRVVTLAGLIWCMLFMRGSTPFWVAVGVPVIYLTHLLVFAAAVRGKFDLKLAHLSCILFDLFFIPLYIQITGGYDSSFYLLYYLTVSVAAYLLTFWLAFAATMVASLSYLVLVLPLQNLHDINDLTLRLGMLWALFLGISYVAEFLRRSEGRLMKLFDTLNLRTAELERSQAQVEMIYENTRILAAILDTDGVVKEVMRLMTQTLQFSTCAVVFRDRRGQFYYRARSVDGQQSHNMKAMEVADNDLIRRVADMHETVRVKDFRERKDYTPLSDASRAVMIVPLTTHGQTNGLLIAEASESKRFSDREEQFLSILARSTALALENSELHKRTEELTIIDELTETFNYRYFIQKLQEEKKRAQRYDLPVSLIMVDIDWFKKLNDTYGHEIGNIVLKELSRIIKRCIRDVDIFARYGGEEFVVILPQTAAAEASLIGERIREQVEGTVIDAGTAGRVKITVSVGVSSFPENGRSQEELVSVADQALYRAKGSGKNSVCTL